MSVFKQTGKLWSMPALLVALALAACNGSGSSGFDAAPQTEGEAIVRAAETADCVAFDATTYCSSHVPVMVGDDSASVAIAEEADAPTCVEVPEGEGEGERCETSVGFMSEGFPEATAYLAATSASVDGPWTLSVAPPQPTPGGDMDDFEVEVIVPDPGGPQAPESALLLLAVLVYLDGVPADLPAEAPQLADFGADFIYVSTDLMVGVVSVP